jgi:hypothetical protein
VLETSLAKSVKSFVFSIDVSGIKKVKKWYSGGSWVYADGSPEAKDRFWMNT